MVHALVRTPVVRFVVVGLAMTVLHLAVFRLLLRLAVPEAANVGAFLVATQVNFAVSYLWTWSSRRPVGRETAGSVLRRALLFTGAASVGFAFNAAAFSTAYRLGGWTPLQSAIAATVVSAAATFLLSSRVVFAHPGGRARSSVTPAQPGAVERSRSGAPVLVSTAPVRLRTTRGT